MNMHRAFDQAGRPLGPERHGADGAIADAEAYARNTEEAAYIRDVEDPVPGGWWLQVRPVEPRRLSAAGTVMVEQVVRDQ